MKTSKFKMLLSNTHNLNTFQFRQLQEEVDSIVSTKEVSALLETPIEELHCPNCNSKEFNRWGKRNDLQRYKCKSCKRTFNSLTNTPLARLRRKGHWLDYSECIKNGMTVRQAASECKIHRNTSFRWRHRFITNTVSIKTQSLEGIVEAKETYFVHSYKGSKKMTSKPRKRGSKSSNKTSSDKKVCVFVGRDRNKNTFDKIFESFSASNSKESLVNIIGKDALFCSDSKSAYFKFTNENNIKHGYLNISKGETVKKNIVHIKNANFYQRSLKDWITNHFKGVATKYLDNYLSWFRELDEFKEDLKPVTVLLRAKSGGKYKLQP